MSTPLHEVARRGHNEVAKILLDSSGKHVTLLIEAKDDNGRTALALASRDGHREVKVYNDFFKLKCVPNIARHFRFLVFDHYDASALTKDNLTEDGFGTKRRVVPAVKST